MPNPLKTGMPKWALQVIASIIMLALMIVALYLSGKDAGSFDMLRQFLAIFATLAYVIIVFCVNYDAELRGSRLHWVAPASVFLGPLGAVLWLLLRPKDYVPFPFCDDDDPDAKQREIDSLEDTPAE